MTPCPVRLPALLVLAALLTACGGAPARPDVAAPEPVPAIPPEPPPAAVDDVGRAAAARALEFLGVPYRYGGSTPSGFDCSGLTQYVYAGLGITLPRTTLEQQSYVAPVDESSLAPGDLVFFRLPDPHVGVYLGDGRFVHAPSSGRSVSVARLSDPYFILGFAGAGRVPR